MNTLITFHTHEAAKAAFDATMAIGGRKFEAGLHIALKPEGRITFRCCATPRDVQSLAGYCFQTIIPGDGKLPEEARTYLLTLMRSWE